MAAFSSRMTRAGVAGRMASARSVCRAIPVIAAAGIPFPQTSPMNASSPPAGAGTTS